jgi:hypothetical protein
VSTVDHDGYTTILKERDDGCHRKDQSGGRSDVIYQGKSGSGGNPCHHRFDYLVRGSQRKGYRGNDDLRIGPSSNVIENVTAGVVDVVGGEEFVTRSKWKRPNHGIDPGRGVGDEAE